MSLKPIVVDRSGDNPTQKIGDEILDRLEELPPRDAVNAIVYAIAALCYTYGVPSSSIASGIDTYLAVMRSGAEEPS